MPIHKSHHSASIFAKSLYPNPSCCQQFPLDFYSSPIINRKIHYRTIHYKIRPTNSCNEPCVPLPRNAPISITCLIYIITTTCKHYSASCFNPVLFLQTKLQVSSIFPILYLSVSLLSKYIACRFPFRNHFSPTS